LLGGGTTVFGMGRTTGPLDGATRSGGRWTGAAVAAADGAGATAAPVLGTAAGGADGAGAAGGGASATAGEALDSLAVDGGTSGALDGRKTHASTATFRASRPPTAIQAVRAERATPGWTGAGRNRTEVVDPRCSAAFRSASRMYDMASGTPSRARARSPPA
jgi:hypothetical protein